MGVTAADILGMLFERYQGREWSCFADVPDGTGFNANRRIDLVAVQNWKPFLTLAVEIKVARGDWLRELDAPEKSVPFTDQVNEFWVASPAGVIKKEEVPTGWGFLQVGADGLRAVVRPKRDLKNQLKDPMMRAILRKISETPAKPWLFRFHGRELVEADLIKIAEKALHGTVERRVENALYQQVHDKLLEDRYYQLGKQILQTFGEYGDSNDAVIRKIHALAKEGAPVRRALINRVRLTLKSFDEDLQSLEKVGDA